MNLSEETLALLKGLRKDVTTAGIGTGTGLNFFYLEPQAKNIYPVFYPLLASTPRVNPMFNGMKVGGTGVNWKAIVSIDSGGYPGISEGNRNAFMNITERDFFAAFKYLGKDTEVSFQAQQTSLGFDDNIALAQFAMLNALLNDEERMLLYGNSGSGGNGYQLGTTPTPVATGVTTGGAIANATNITLFCVALTPWGVQMLSSTGVQLPFVRTNADSSTDTINGGTAVISAASNTVLTGNTTTHVTGTVAAVLGAVAYAWFVSANASPTTANAKFAGVTPYPKVDIDDGVILSSIGDTTQKSLPYLGVASAQLANAQSATVAGAAGNLTADHSANSLDFDGLLTWTFGANASATTPSFVKDAGGAGFTSNGDGTIAEWEAVADYLWNAFKISIDAIYLGGTLIQAASKAILTSQSGPGAQRIILDRGSKGEITGGQIVSEYNWKYSGTATRKVVPVKAHPWLPQGVVYFDLSTNPYPAAGNAIPAVRRIVSLEDHFSIKWPYRKLQHELGVYCFETVENYIPFGSAIYSGFANKVN